MSLTWERYPMGTACEHAGVSLFVRRHGCLWLASVAPPTGKPEELRIPDSDAAEAEAKAWCEDRCEAYLLARAAWYSERAREVREVREVRT